MIFKFLILLLFVGHVASYTYKYVNDPKLFEVVNANWKVAIDMYKQLLKKNPGDGFLFSPYSMIVDLLGLHEGANGHTANAIRCKLGLANITSHYKCKWEVQFDSVIQGQFKTVDGAFKPQTYMEKTGVFKIGYIPNLSLRILELPYFNNTLASYIFLPNCSVGLTAFETSRLDTKTLIDLIAALKPMNARISIPRFEASSHHQLSSDFEAIGLGNLFTPGEADFSRIYSNAVADKLALNYYVQQASVSFDIEGANSPSQETPVNPETTEEFKADHSFLYVIIGKRRNVPFFIGRYNG
ncbi:plasminogen activator inhibitor 2 type A-like isoform X2 [Gordionus sp. m RMFG-2023]|uniref:plasminogen activator inhibitor 2 type A-like isoform X2 n=1 Tax=Gordionus sp. m RMFG-2023 TaxID=3053472 RepID=UPI0031FDE00A